MVKIKYKDIKDIYEIDEYGNIYSKYKKQFLKPKIDKYGYLQVTLQGENRKVYIGIATLVAHHFIGEPPNYIKDVTVDHINGIRTDNYYKNLRWLERSANSSIRKNKGVGQLNHESKLNEQQVIEICELLLENKLTLQEIANIYRVHKTTISNIKRKVNWKHITKNYIFPKINVIRNEKGKYCRFGSTGK